MRILIEYIATEGVFYIHSTAPMAPFLGTIDAVEGVEYITPNGRHSVRIQAGRAFSLDDVMDRVCRALDQTPLEDIAKNGDYVPKDKIAVDTPPAE